MLLKANGKLIDTLPMKHLLSVGEASADIIVFQVDRYYNAKDLYDFTFVMRGVTESGTEASAVLVKRLSEDEEYINLIWNISGAFTAEAGQLFLDLRAYQYTNPETDVTQNPPDCLLRYQLPAVEVREIPESQNQNTE